MLCPLYWINALGDWVNDLGDKPSISATFSTIVNKLLITIHDLGASSLIELACSNNVILKLTNVKK